MTESTLPTSQPRGSSRRQARLTLGACCSVHGLQDGLTATVFVLLPLLGQHFGLSYASVGIIRATHTCALSLFEYPSAILGDRQGAPRLLVFGLTCAGTGYVALSQAGGFITVLCALFLTGIGNAFQHSLASSLLSDTFEDGSRRVALGTYNSAGDVGKLVATGTMSLLLGMGVGWQSVSAGYGLVALTAAALLFVVLRCSARTRPIAAVDAATSADRGIGLRDRRGFLALIAIVFVDTGVQDGFLVFVAFLMLEKQVPPGLAAAAVVLTLGGGVLGKFACGILAARLGVIRSLLLVEILTAAGITAVVLAPPLVAFGLLPLLGTVLQGSSSITYGTVGELVERRGSSRAFGVVYSVTGVAGILTPVSLGLLADGADIGAAMIALATVSLVPLPLCAILGPALRRLRGAY